MTTHLRYESQTRTETDAEVIANLTRKGWEVFTPEPVVEVPPTYTAESFLSAQGYTALRIVSCLDLEAKLAAAQVTSPKLAATRQWLDAITLLAAPNPDAQRSDWPLPPWSFAEASGEALGVLAGQNPET